MNGELTQEELQEMFNEVERQRREQPRYSTRTGRLVLGGQGNPYRTRELTDSGKITNFATESVTDLEGRAVPVTNKREAWRLRGEDGKPKFRTGTRGKSTLIDWTEFQDIYSGQWGVPERALNHTREPRSIPDFRHELTESERAEFIARISGISPVVMEGTTASMSMEIRGEPATFSEGLNGNIYHREPFVAQPYVPHDEIIEQELAETRARIAPLIAPLTVFPTHRQEYVGGIDWARNGGDRDGDQNE